MKNKLKSLNKPLSFFLAVGALVLINQSSKLNKYYVNNKASENVVKLLASDSGGTGFILNTDNGTQVIITNNHVCGEETELVAETGIDSRVVKVLGHSKEHDLCIVEAIPGRSGLNLGSEPSQGDDLYILGHPYLLPQTLTSGEMSNKMDLLFVVSAYTGVEKCDDIQVETFFGIPIGTVCLKKRQVFLVTVPAAPGNSGSPVLNIWGNVVGVLFAGYPQGASNLVVPAKFIKSLIKLY